MQFIYRLSTLLLTVAILSKPQGTLALLPTAIGQIDEAHSVALSVVARANVDRKIVVLKESSAAIRIYSKTDKVSAANDLIRQGGDKYKKGDYQGAIADYTKALRLNPKSAEAYNYRGNARLNLRNKQGAISDYNQAIKINPKYADAFDDRGDGRSALGDNQGAIDDYDQAIRVDPYYARAYANRGLVRSTLGDKQGALADLQQAAALAQQQGKTYLYQNILDTMKAIR
ncbi:MAG: tetratricopeptide repeat protein [Chroococcidiopsidaceae cyanobacterium CP_BM_ER_R8_30]|nr:tetratricopeptide repeat protein [Chroococcidiopsidaceae cyanobacterium CP_BM_ER_R8_30]